MTHSGRKSNKCDQCDFASALAGNLKAHLKTHRGGKPNKCNHCDFASARAGNFRTHLIKHSGVKLHKCNQCDFTSYRKRNMTTHLETHNWENCTHAQWIKIKQMQPVQLCIFLGFLGYPNDDLCYLHSGFSIQTEKYSTVIYYSNVLGVTMPALVQAV